MDDCPQMQFLRADSEAVRLHSRERSVDCVAYNGCEAFSHLAPEVSTSPAVQPASAQDLLQPLGTEAQHYFINQFLGCLHAERGDARCELSPKLLSVEIPACTSHAFAGVPDDIQSKTLISGLPRSSTGMYEVPSSRDASSV